MEDYKVLITTSGLGSRLGELTDYTNKSLIRVADKPVISYIIESYPDNVEFVISLGYFGSHVKQFLDLTYPNRKFIYVEVDKYKGDGSSLGYSILKCKNELQCPFIFHTSDTIINEYKCIVPNINYIITSYKQDSAQYRTVKLNADKVIHINEKGELIFDSSYVGICGIFNYELFFDILENLNKTQDISDVHVINKMLSEVNFYNKNVAENNWYDTGNTTELIRTKKSFKSNIEVLDKKDESIFFFDDFVVKFFYDKSINKNRVDRSFKLKNLVPDMVSYTDNFYKYKKAKGILFSKSVNRLKFHNFLNWSKDNLWKFKEDDKIKEKCFNFYIKKTEERINKYLKFNVDENVINGEHIPNIFELLKSIDTDWLCKGIPCQFHGDFILDNVIETEDGFCLIDWRQDFSGDLDVGDIYYDLSKLHHNLIVNHDIVNRNLFNADSNDCHIFTNSKLNQCREILYNFIKENSYDLKKVNILTSLIWINMSPLHEYPFNKFLFNFGKYNLHLNLNS